MLLRIGYNMLSRKKGLPRMCYCSLDFAIDMAVTIPDIIITTLDRSQITKTRQFDYVGDLI